MPAWHLPSKSAPGLKGYLLTSPLCLLAADSSSLFLNAFPLPHSSSPHSPSLQPCSTLPAGFLTDVSRQHLVFCRRSESSAASLNFTTFPLPGSSTTKAGPGKGTWGPQSKGPDKRQEPVSRGHGQASRDQRRGSFPARDPTASFGRISSAESPGPHSNTGGDAAGAAQKSAPHSPRGWHGMGTGGSQRSPTPRTCITLHNKCFVMSLCHTPRNFANLPLATVV